MRINRLKKSAILFISFLLFYMLTNAHAASVSGGDVARKIDADVVVDIVFAIDTSGSMGDEARNISNAIQSALTNMQCADIDVWVNARLVGLQRTWGGTLFDERAESVLASVGADITINHSEDNGPVVFDFATANSAYYIDSTEPNQGYVKAIVTIGDEGLQNGASVNQSDYDIGKMANAIAIENNVLVFSLLGNYPSRNAPALFKALAEGGDILGGHVFSETGGSFTTTTDTTPYEEVLEDVFCQSAQTLLKNVKVVSVLSTNNIDLDSSSFAQTPHSIDIIGNETFIEWRFPTISIGQIENLDYEVILQNPVAGESRLVTRQLDVYYTDINGNEVHSALGSQSVEVLPSVFQLAVETDKSTYTIEENVLIQTQISNLSQYDQVADVKVTIQDGNGTLVEDYGVTHDVTIIAGQFWQHPELSFFTATSFEGAYEVHAQLLDKNGSEIALAIAPLVIVTPSENKVTGTISTDKLAYEAFDTVSVLSRIQNIAPNALLEGYTAVATIYKPDNELLWTQTTALPQMLPESIKDLNDTVILNSAAPGNYRAILLVLDKTGLERSLSETSFTVQSTNMTGSGLSGSISVNPNPVLKTEDLILNAHISNEGNSALANLPVTLSIIDPESESILAEWTQTLNQLMEQQEETLQQHTWQAEGQVGANYIAVLSAQLNGQTKYLARTPFVIAEKIASHLEIGEAGRLLILLDPPSNSDSQSTEQAFEDNAELQRQRFYLETLLIENGWSYTIVTDKDSFARELRGHAYTQYALFSARVKLDEQVQKELREAIYKGDGLLQAGDHDQRYNQLDEALGTRIQGKHNSVAGLELLESEWQLIGHTDWYPDDKPLKAELLETAQAMGFYLGLKDNANNLAIARNTYGLGRTVFMGFDLLAHASIEGADTLYSELLLTALADSSPSVKTEYTAQDPVAIQLSLTNRGTATQVKTTLTLPAGSLVLDSGGAQQTGEGAWQWISTLATQETTTQTLWIRLPESTESEVIVNAQILIEQNGIWQTYDTRDLLLSLLPGTSFNDVLIELQGLIPAQSYKPALQAIDKALASYEQMQYSKSLQFLLQASDSLIRLKTGQADRLRQKIALLIAVIEREV